jgi:hypothetical protein
MFLLEESIALSVGEYTPVSTVYCMLHAAFCLLPV